MAEAPQRRDKAPQRRGKAPQRPGKDPQRPGKAALLLVRTAIPSGREDLRSIGDFMNAS